MALSLLEACFDLISGSSLHMKIQTMGVKITENLGFKPAPEGQHFFVLFSFHFLTLHKKLHIFVFTIFEYLIMLNHGPFVQSNMCILDLIPAED